MIEFYIPNGYEPVAFRAPKMNELFIDYKNGGVVLCNVNTDPYPKRLIVKRTKPKRIILERVEESVETPMKANKGEFYESPNKGLTERIYEGYSANKHIIWRRVEE